MVTPM